MSSERKAKSQGRVASKVPGSSGNATSPRPPSAASLPPLPPGAQPTHEELLHFFKKSRDLLCIADFDGKLRKLNPAWLPVLGWTLEELKARPFLDFVHPDDRAATLVEMERLASGTDTIAFENRYQIKDGSWRWLEWTSSALVGGKQIYAIARDITRRKSLEEEILGTLDRERERVGRELHDGLCQNLAGIVARITTLARTLDPIAATTSAAAREIGGLLSQSIRHVRDLARGFIPLHLKGIGLVPALRDFCANTAALFEIACRFHCRRPPANLDWNRKSHLYRIAQEAMSNAITHGRTKSIDVTLAFRKGRGTLTIEDDGTGIPAALDHGIGLGFHTMAYRARLIGGTLDVQRRSPRGTVVTCDFPLPPPAPAPSPHGKTKTKDPAQKARKTKNPARR